jgi:hypothetical protein
VALRLKLTEVPSATLAPVIVVTVAWMLDVPVVVIEEGVAVRVILAGAGLPVGTVSPVPETGVPAAMSSLLGAPHELNHKTDKSNMTDFNPVLVTDSSFLISPSIFSR